MRRPLTHCSTKSHSPGVPPPASAPCLLLTRPSQGTEGLGEVSGLCAGGPWGAQAGTRNKPMFGFVAGWPRGRNVQVPGFQHLRWLTALIGNRASRWCDPYGKGVPGPRLTAP